MSPAGKRSQVRRGGGDVVGPWLPEELQIGILSRLPTPASIARFRCVSKSWRRLLTDDGELICKILLPDDDIRGEEEAHVMTVTTASKTYSIHSYSDDEPVSSGTLPGSGTLLLPIIVGCSGGIFCICDFHDMGKIILWNPTTSETKMLPRIWVLWSYSRSVSAHVGFGFDPVTEDYKVLVWLWERRRQIYLYSLMKNSWKRLRPAGLRLPSSPGDQVGLVASRAPEFSRCHWINPNFHNYFPLTTFDMSTEAFTVLRLPLPPVKRSAVDVALAATSFHMVKGGSCLVAVYSGTSSWPSTTPSSIFLEVWAALDYKALAATRRRKECSWIRLYNVDHAPVLDDLAPERAWQWEHGKFFVQLCSRRRSTRRRVTVNGVVDYKANCGYLERVAYLPSTTSLASRRWNSLLISCVLHFPCFHYNLQERTEPQQTAS